MGSDRDTAVENVLLSHGLTTFINTETPVDMSVHWASTHRSTAGVGRGDLVIHPLSTVLSGSHVLGICVCRSSKGCNDSNNISNEASS